MMNNGFWEEPAGRRLKRRIGLVSCILILFNIVCCVTYFASRVEPKKAGNHWRNWDSSRSLSDVKAYDYDNGLIIYRDEEPSEPAKTFEWQYDEQTYCDPATYYEDYYEDIYEFFHD